MPKTKIQMRNVIVINAQSSNPAQKKKRNKKLSYESVKISAEETVTRVKAIAFIWQTPI